MEFTESKFSVIIYTARHACQLVDEKRVNQYAIVLTQQLPRLLRLLFDKLFYLCLRFICGQGASIVGANDENIATQWNVCMS